MKESSRQEELAARLAKRLQADRDLVIVDIRSQDNPFYRPPDVPLEADIRVVDEKGLDERLGDMAESLSKTLRVEPEASLFVYAPVDDADRANRNREYSRLESVCRLEIETWFKEAN